jgi:GT2 family glycosyltransferase
MIASIVIPVWNGNSVVSDCLDAILAHSGEQVPQIICVDNASDDGSVALIADQYPGVNLIRQSVNLGFAGGVNAGIDAAQGEVFVLLNQDCLVQPGWLVALIQALETHPEFGIAGCTILNTDGTVNHAGAMIRQPDAFGVHLTEVVCEQPRSVECVTGAAIAIRRETWNEVGRFDEGYFPAYYEDSDYCYRARRKGLEVALVPDARIIHLFSSREWQRDPVKHTANQHLSRYRFVSKHFDSHETSDFFDAECAAAQAEDFYDQAVGRVIAARNTLRSLADILERRQLDLEDRPAPSHRRELQTGFTRVLRQSFATAERLGQVDLGEPPLEEWEAANQRLQEALSAPLTADLNTLAEQKEAARQLQELQQREHDLLARIHFRSPAADEPESTLRRMSRLLVLRPLSFLVGRDYLLLSELNAVHVARMDQMEHTYRATLDQVIRAYSTKMEQIHQLCSDRTTRDTLLLHHHQERLKRRLELLELLADYDYR